MLGPNPEAKGEGRSVLRCEAVSKRYGRGRGGRQVLDRVDLSVAPGEVLAVAGANGSGKSTLLVSPAYAVLSRLQNTPVPGPLLAPTAGLLTVTSGILAASVALTHVLGRRTD